MKRTEFEKLVEEAILILPERIRKKMDNVGIVIEKRPRKLNPKSKNYLLGLYQGIPKTTWGRGFGGNLPDKITIFQEPIEKFARSKEEIKNIVQDVVWHEIAHHFGFDEKGIELLKIKRKMKRAID